jgi:hypothetical protein
VVVHRLLAIVIDTALYQAHGVIDAALYQVLWVIDMFSAFPLG